MAVSVLIVDDEDAIREQVGAFLEARGYEVGDAPDGPRALALAASGAFRVALIDFKMPGMDGIALLGELRARHPELVVLMMTAHASVDSAVRALKSGAHDYLPKPVSPDELEHKLKILSDNLRTQDELEALRRQLGEGERFEELVGASVAMRRVYELIESAAKSDLGVLITGETGTGKELAARALHVRSRRAGKPFVAINCAALPDGLVESELFGHVKGAFTGAASHRAGRLVSAEGGTVLLDELAAAPLSLQARLLRVLEEGELLPVGSDTPRAIDVRVVAAMNLEPAQAVATGKVREDLLYRLNAFHVIMPPLRERRDDIPRLAAHFARRSGSSRPLTPELVEALTRRRWRGNVRELRNVVGAAMAVGEGPVTLAHVPAALREETPAPALETQGTLREHLAACERELVQAVLRDEHGNVRRAAERLGIDERSLRRKLGALGLARGDFVPK